MGMVKADTRIIGIMFHKIGNRGAVAFAEDKTQKIFGGAYVVAPQADDTWYNNYSKGYIKSVKAMIDEFASENNVDKNRIYIFGASAGGYMSFRMIIEYPDYFAAFSTSAAALDKAAISGGVTTTAQDLMKIRNKPLWMVHAQMIRLFPTKIQVKEFMTFFQNMEQYFPLIQM